MCRQLKKQLTPSLPSKSKRAKSLAKTKEALTAKCWRAKVAAENLMLSHLEAVTVNRVYSQYSTYVYVFKGTVSMQN